MKNKIWNIVISALIIGAIIFFVFFIGIDTITDQEALVQYIKQFGIFAPLAFFIIQFLQVILAPIPGNITGLVGGAIFGLWWGFLLNGSAIFLGAALMFYLGRKYGKKITHKFISKEELEKYEKKLSGKAGKSILFGLFLLPFSPDDALCLIAGLTNIDYKTFYIILLAGRMPSSFITNAVGAGLYNGHVGYIILLSIIYYITVFVIYINYDKIKSYRENKKSK